VIGTSCGRIHTPLTAGRHFIPLARTPFHKELPSLDTRGDKATLKAGLFVGCLIDKFFPEVGRATVKALEYHRVGIFIPPGQGCCGIPALSSGDLPTFQKLLLHNLELYENEDIDALLTACATCTMTIKEVWPKFAPALPKKRRKALDALCEKTADICEFLVKRAGVAENAEAEAGGDDLIPVTYHDPCHLRKSLGIFKEPRTVIKASKGYRLTEMLQPDKCCGMGGSFNLQYYEISRGIGELKRDNIESSGAKIVATGCPACMSQISDMLSSARLKIAVKHPVELYAESIEQKIEQNH
jgi:glycolate oxidase iron-sulfur subunit